MKNVLQLTFFAVALIFLSGSSSPADAQRFSRYDDAGHAQASSTVRQRQRASKSRRARLRASRRSSAARARSGRFEGNAIGRNRNRKKAARKRSSRKKLASYRKKNRHRKKRRKVARRKAKAHVVKNSKASKEPVQIVVSLPRQRVSIYKGGKVVASSRVSTGKAGHRTPSGVFSIIQKHRIHHSNLYGSAPMPYMQRITWSGVALHAGNVSRRFASHGCIRLPYGFAKKLYRRTNMGAHVIVSRESSPIRSISHEKLFQPMPEGVAMEAGGVKTAAHSSQNSLEDVAVDPGTGGLPGFVKPTIVAAKNITAKEKALQEEEGKLPALEEAFTAAQAVMEEKRLVFVADSKLEAEQVKTLDTPFAALVKAKKKMAPLKKALKKAKGRADWARHIVEKRKGNKKFEGNWMKKALARLEAREAVVARAQDKLDAEQELVNVEKTAYLEVKKDVDRFIARSDASRNAFNEAGKQVKQAKADIGAKKRDIVTAKRELKSANAELVASKLREKMPLRILITPRKNRERTKDVQRLLSELGYDAGVADGSVGEQTIKAIKSFQIEMNVKQTGMVSDKLIEDLYARSGHSQSANAHMYVRQGFRDLFDVPVSVDDIEKPLGTHVYTAMYFNEEATSTRWTVLTAKRAAYKSKVKKSRKRRKSRRKAKVRYISQTASQVLDRISIPGNARRQVSKLLTPGSSLLVSDKGMSYETGKGTDFVVLTK